MSDRVTAANDIRQEHKIVTKDILETALRSGGANNELQVKNFSIKDGSIPGENFTTVVFSVNVTTTDRSGTETNHDLLLKIAPENRKRWTSESKIFLKEGGTYSTIVPEMIRYQQDLGIEPFGPSVPTFYPLKAETDSSIIILEDMRPLGFKLGDKMNGLDKDHCEIVMRKLAEWHALSYALKKGDSENLKKYDFLFHESYSADRMLDVMVNLVNASVSMVKQGSVDLNFNERIDKLLTLNIREAMRDLLKAREPFALICHGDLWCNNILFKYNEEEGVSKPVDAKLIDLQIVRYALPSTDLVYFLLTSTTQDTRKNYMHHLLRVYHSTFIDCLARLSLEFTEFTFDVLLSLVKESFLYGVLMACMVLPIAIKNPFQDNILKNARIPEAASVSIFRENFAKIPEIGDKASDVKARLCGVFYDAMEMGVL